MHRRPDPTRRLLWSGAFARYPAAPRSAPSSFRVVRAPADSIFLLYVQPGMRADDRRHRPTATCVAMRPLLRHRPVPAFDAETAVAASRPIARSRRAFALSYELGRRWRSSCEVRVKLVAYVHTSAAWICRRRGIRRAQAPPCHSPSRAVLQASGAIDAWTDCSRHGLTRAHDHQLGAVLGRVGAAVVALQAPDDRRLYSVRWPPRTRGSVSRPIRQRHQVPTGRVKRMTIYDAGARPGYRRADFACLICASRSAGRSFWRLSGARVPLRDFPERPTSRAAPRVRPLRAAIGPIRGRAFDSSGTAFMTAKVLNGGASPLRNIDRSPSRREGFRSRAALSCSCGYIR